MSFEQTASSYPSARSLEELHQARKQTRNDFYATLHRAIAGQNRYHEDQLPPNVRRARAAYVVANSELVGSLQATTGEELYLAGRSSHAMRFVGHPLSREYRELFRHEIGSYDSDPSANAIQGVLTVVGVEIGSFDSPETATILVSRGLGNIVDMDIGAQSDRGWVIPLSSLVVLSRA
ncbi:hypothetical protein KBC77_01635 [Candidatus Saccharibacteria bacterium]|nr:hypothetical protein [Candidatus Saccharibacteria bacterium]